MPFGAAHWPYIIILLVIVLIIWGPGKLPDLGAGMGKAIREFRKASSDIRDNVVNATASEPDKEAGQEPVSAAKTEAKEERPTTV
ncbi:MAG TPA: twin-arginine translocase TatA/TatE family subunit [Candidatus Dormibacteraeota bacterium]|jgi:sec-independent protein translocase protein TatA|nr:twin-arginine translocase TatA/TatE family subunit [Candidatus Dormibacteraeota bacterium]